MKPKVRYHNVSEVPGILLLFLRYLVLLQPYVQYRPLRPIYAKICQYPEISINQEICGQKTNLYAILWKILTFMKFFGDNHDIYEIAKLFICNASWDILNRTFLNRIPKYNVEVSKLPWLQKKEYQE